MIRFVQHKDIDSIKWDQAIAKAQYSTLFARYEMLDALTSPGTWHALVEDDYHAVMPLPARSKFGISYLYTPFFMPQMGIFSPATLACPDTRLFLAAIPQRYRQADLVLNVHNETDEAATELVSHTLDLQKPYEHLRAQFSQNTVRNIRSAERQGTIITLGEPVIEETIRLFRENRGHVSDVHFQAQDYQRLAVVARHLEAQGALLTVSARTPDGTLIAGALFVLDAPRMWFWFSGRDNRYAEYKPLFLLMDRVIQHYADQAWILDFNGSRNPNVARMYRSFGGEPYTIPLVSLSRSKILQKMAEVGRKIRR